MNRAEAQQGRVAASYRAGGYVLSLALWAVLPSLTSCRASSDKGSTGPAFDRPSELMVVSLTYRVDAGANPDSTAAVLSTFGAGTCRLDALASCSAHFQVSVRLSRRGESSRRFYDKPSYNVTLPKERPVASDIFGPGSPDGRKWRLVACYADRSCMRNALSYEIARAMGAPAPRTRFLELFSNGQYVGLYLLTEKVGRKRLGVTRQVDPNGRGTGGFIIRREGRGKGHGRDWVAASGNVWTHEFPKASGMSVAEATVLRSHVDEFERLITAGTWRDPKGKGGAQIDLPSWVDYGIVQELSNNVDGYWKSMFLYARPEGRSLRWLAGPVWDFDLAFGNTTIRHGESATEWAFEGNDRSGTDRVVPAFWERLWSDRSFTDPVVGRWSELRQGVLSQDRLHQVVQHWAQEIRNARLRDDHVWHTFGRPVRLAAPPHGSFDEELTALTLWLDERLAWLDSRWLHKPGPTTASGAPSEHRSGPGSNQ